MEKYYIKQKLSGFFIVAVGILLPFLDNGNATFTLLALPLGLHLLTTKKKVMDFDGK